MKIKYARDHYYTLLNGKRSRIPRQDRSIAFTVDVLPPVVVQCDGSPDSSVGSPAYDKCKVRGE